jgi:hypothetical protein
MDKVYATTKEGVAKNLWDYGRRSSVRQGETLRVAMLVVCKLAVHSWLCVVKMTWFCGNAYTPSYYRF